MKQEKTCLNKETSLIVEDQLITCMEDNASFLSRDQKPLSWGRDEIRSMLPRDHTSWTFEI